jgi:hypothetical protein
MPFCYLHAGTHKTGTTALQRMLGANEALLERSGILVPQTGRLAADFGSHHPIAWELNQSPQFDPSLGTLEALVDEVAAKKPPVVCISSEDFEQLFRKPDALRRFAGAFERIGYVVKPIFYLRPQAEYFEVIYADAIRSGAVFRFEWLMGDIFETGMYCPLSNDALPFAYSELLDAFAAAFRRENVIARRYRSGAAPTCIVREFLRIISASVAPLPMGEVAMPPRLNPSLRFGELLQTLSANCESHGHGPLPLAEGSAEFDHHCDFIHYSEARAFVRRFAQDNRRIARDYGVRVPAVDPVAYANDLGTALGFNPGSSARRRALDAVAPWLAFMPNRS